jgi:hypothetical protein
LADLLDILPPDEAPVTVTVVARNKKKLDIEIHPLKVADIKKLAMRFRDLRNSLFKNAPEDIRGVAMTEAMPAIIAAGTGHIGDEAYEEHVEKVLSQPEIMKLGGAILTLTYPTEDADDSPLESAAEIIAAAKAEVAETTSEPQ